MKNLENLLVKSLWTTVLIINKKDIMKKECKIIILALASIFVFGVIAEKFGESVGESLNRDIQRNESINSYD